MSLSSEEISHIATLARLELTPEEREAFQRQLSSVLDYVGQLRKVDTTGVEPMSHSVELRNVLRPDEVQAAPPAVRERLVKSFPAKDGDLLRTDAVFS
ncbi:hypothetical protein A3C96_00585 [Candidatus Uhrbacteria bacterium RIFCSPHIGHO2_02_FULL_60_10]|uniref:Aspartyl/glutamyl-tRNA(Asn/Gln) amidotransferase subunit C n=1 Tax=Candidatus Uhrbacteria bacterium RIFCSPHIGHO2_02_FULL_60_10 TaxID=1802392 RepID=A0A1F7U9Y5_9BACT|nr:MAG: hypothetical protein A3C96_00585 [Candidatus Uhrbacteria bacterium RIFCSPHIGHO2_02_FULL_60_10]